MSPVVKSATSLTFRRRIKSRLPFAGIIRRLPYSTRLQDEGLNWDCLGNLKKYKQNMNNIDNQLDATITAY